MKSPCRPVVICRLTSDKSLECLHRSRSHKTIFAIPQLPPPWSHGRPVLFNIQPFDRCSIMIVRTRSRLVSADTGCAGVSCSQTNLLAACTVRHHENRRPGGRPVPRRLCSTAVFQAVEVCGKIEGAYIPVGSVALDDTVSSPASGWRSIPGGRGSAKEHIRSDFGLRRNGANKVRSSSSGLPPGASEVGRNLLVEVGHNPSKQEII